MQKKKSLGDDYIFQWLCFKLTINAKKKSLGDVFFLLKM